MVVRHALCANVTVEVDRVDDSFRSDLNPSHMVAESTEVDL